ncbi:MAG: mannose-6-phosphate isomerase, class I [Desulfobacterales bacterium]|jgi:mannose-6-phosphate isomerase
MNKIFPLKNTIQKYAWGSLTAIPELLGYQNSPAKPQAELWMGAHPKAPSMVENDDRPLPLDKLIEKYPSEILGKRVAARFGNRLPYLFKVLAAAKPLSLQAHPSLAQAKDGYRRENDLGIPLDAPHRNYKDDSHKPECICALTPFWALNGFRKIPEMLTLFELISPPGLQNQLRQLKQNQNSQGLKRFFHAMMVLPPVVQKQVTDEALARIDRPLEENPVFKWMVTLSHTYPGDIGILFPLILNLICLHPGEAMFLPAGELHAYFEGMGIELMANSDNVLRGGLTPKHIDVEELLNVLNFTEKKIDILLPEERDNSEKVYPSQAEEFVLSVLTLVKGRIYKSSSNRSIELIICTRGDAVINNMAGAETISLKRGTSVMIPAAVKSYRIEGSATLYKAAVPI